MLTGRKRIGSPALWAVWLATRTGLYLLATAPGQAGDVGIYQRWDTCCFSHLRFLLADPMWQYPPGAALILWLPGRLPGSYLHHFVFLAIGCDLAATLMLCARARRGGSLAGAWYWVCGMPLLGGVVRYQVRCGPCRASLLRGLVRDRPWRRPWRPGRSRCGGQDLAGRAAGLPGSRSPAPQRWPLAVAVPSPSACVVCPAARTANFLAHQNARGVEIESVAATPFMIARRAG